MRKIFVTGIGTEVGKTIISAVLTEALQADFWKPIQCGNLEMSDTQRVQRLVSNDISVFHPEAYQFEQQYAPYLASKLSDEKVRLGKLSPPETENTLIIEGAGGILIPYNYRGDTLFDVALQHEAEIVVVCKHYAGSINHTLLTLEHLKQTGATVLGIIFNGKADRDNERVILNKSKIPVLGRINFEFELSKEVIKRYAHDYVFI